MTTAAFGPASTPSVQLFFSFLVHTIAFLRISLRLLCIFIDIAVGGQFFGLRNWNGILPYFKAVFLRRRLVGGCFVSRATSLRRLVGGCLGWRAESLLRGDVWVEGFIVAPLAFFLSLTSFFSLTPFFCSIIASAVAWHVLCLLNWNVILPYFHAGFLLWRLGGVKWA